MLVKRSRTFRAMQKRFRLKRFLRIEDMIRRLASETSRVRILDLGGTAEYWEMLAPDLRSQVEVTLVNFESELDLYDAEIEGLEIRHHVGDACDLPEFGDGSFDLVHSNSVVEHVGSYSNMLRFASEVRRLGRFYCVQTPNFWFPVDPHYGRPFVHWVPEPTRIALYQRIRISQAPKADFDTAMARCDDCKIIDAGMMRRLFPDGRQERERFCWLTKSVMMIRDSSPQGGVRGTCLEWGQCVRLEDEQTQPIPVLKDEPRDHPSCGDAVHPQCFVTAELRRPAARAWHRRQPGNRPILAAGQYKGMNRLDEWIDCGCWRRAIQGFRFCFQVLAQMQPLPTKAPEQLG